MLRHAQQTGREGRHSAAQGRKDLQRANSKAERHVRDVLVVLVLSLVNERERQQDGFLRAHEVYNQKLNADLVALSGRRADLMKQFYKGMLADGLRPAAALHAAQVAMWKEKRAPYFWAAFVLQGEWL
jgi:CHAT domain